MEKICSYCKNASKYELGKESHGERKMMRCWNTFFLGLHRRETQLSLEWGGLVNLWSHGLCCGWACVGQVSDDNVSQSLFAFFEHRDLCWAHLTLQLVAWVDSLTLLDAPGTLGALRLCWQRGRRLPLWLEQQRTCSGFSKLSELPVVTLLEGCDCGHHPHTWSLVVQVLH